MNDLQLLLEFADHLDYEAAYCKNSDGTFTAFFHGDELHFNSDGMIAGIVKSEDRD
jgi:hypothetical protein